MKCLFVPDNILLIFCEEQALFQSLLDFQFYNTIPYCPVEIETNNFTSLEITPPENYNDIIIRKCFGISNGCEKKAYIGNFILGNAGGYANTLLRKIKMEKLKKKARNNKIFEIIKCKVRYTAEFEITHNATLTKWVIKNIKWEK
ncbi:MAG: hypothetical protein CR988_06710 [Treponema sp.]|nr:MAG: hypothetical protein CR988_06710 [Treponema sp.]